MASAVAGLLGLAPDAGTPWVRSGSPPRRVACSQAPLVSQLIFVGILSVNLAVLNVLPFRRSTAAGSRSCWSRRSVVALPAEREALVYLTGFMVLIALVILISIRDVANLIGA